MRTFSSEGGDNKHDWMEGAAKKTEELQRKRTDGAGTLEERGTGARGIKVGLGKGLEVSVGGS